MKFKQFILGIFLMTFGVAAMAQPDTTNNPKSRIVRPYTVIEGDTVPWDILDEVMVVVTPTFDNDEAQRRYYILRRKVMKVYPYAVMAGDKLDSLNLKLDGLTSKKRRKKYIKEYQVFLEQRFEPELKMLTRSEGQILSKLIYRETGMSVFDLIKEYRSGWSAFWWSTSASWYDISIKKPYLPKEESEDKLIENILQRAFQQQLLNERVPFYPPKKE